jgi:hypothetical protein
MKQFAFFLFLLSSLASAETLNLTAGTMTSGGMLGAKYLVPDTSAFGSGAWSVDAKFDFGVFVADNFALTFDVGAQANLTTATDPDRMFMLGVNGLYAFDTDTMLRPYLALGIYGANWTPTGQAATAWGAGGKGLVGLLVGLNEHVALDFGVQAKMRFPLAGAAAKTTFEGAAGYFGVRGFF